MLIADNIASAFSAFRQFSSLSGTHSRLSAVAILRSKAEYLSQPTMTAIKTANINNNFFIKVAKKRLRRAKIALFFIYDKKYCEKNLNKWKKSAEKCRPLYQ